MTWDRHVNLVLTVLVRALTLLRSRVSNKESEISLNRELYFCLIQANEELHRSTGEAFNHQPTAEAKNPPDPDDEQRAKCENKIPDFSWGFIDHTSPDPRRAARNFCIECKRLGKPMRTDRVFNENYIHHGVLRFITKEHGYAQGEKAAAMVGYVQNMDFVDILAEVNETARMVSVPSLNGPSGGWQTAGTSALNHQLSRPFRVSPLTLHHFWIDLRRS
jgi:hypothetical protein